MSLCRVGFPHYFPGSCVCLGVPRSLDWWLFLELALDLVSEVREALRKSGGFVFGDRLPSLAIFMRGTLSQRRPRRGSPTRRQDETALAHMKFFRVKSYSQGGAEGKPQSASWSLPGCGAPCRGRMLSIGGLGGHGDTRPG